MSKAPLIVLVEDNAADVFMVRTALEEAGLTFEMQVFRDGESTLRYIGQVEDGTAAAPEILLLDLNLPRYSGEAILERVRKGRRCASLPVVVLTSSDSPKDRERATALGAQYFRKPADLDLYMSLGPMVIGIMCSQGAPARDNTLS